MRLVLPCRSRNRTLAPERQHLAGRGLLRYPLSIDDNEDLRLTFEPGMSEPREAQRFWLRDALRDDRQITALIRLERHRFQTALDEHVVAKGQFL